MTKILVINTSQNTETSKSRALVNHYISALREKGLDFEIKTRDVGVTPPPHLDGPTIGAFFTMPADRSDEQKGLIALSDELVAELRDADMILIGSAMQNFGITSGLKAWFDHVARVGETFRYTENGPEGLLGGRKVVVLAASGGDYTQGAAAALNHQTPHLKTLFGFLGIDDVETVVAPGTAVNDDGVEAAKTQIDDIAATAASGDTKAA